jgi:hypothetical protein
MKRIFSMVALTGVCCGLTAGLLCGCSGSKSPNGMSDANERKIFAGDASKMPASARQQMEAATKAGQAGAKMPVKQ